MPRKVAEQERLAAAEWIVAVLSERQELLANDRYTDAHNRQARKLCSLLLWQHSEATGKYRGCRYWSTGALESEKRHGRAVTSKALIGADALRHEHLFPRKSLINRLFDIKRPSMDNVRALLDRLNIGVVVTAAEHEKLSADGNESDPWDRYREAGVECVNRFRERPT